MARNYGIMLLGVLLLNACFDDVQQDRQTLLSRYQAMLQFPITADYDIHISDLLSVEQTQRGRLYVAPGHRFRRDYELEFAVAIPWKEMKAHLSSDGRDVWFESRIESVQEQYAMTIALSNVADLEQHHMMASALAEEPIALIGRALHELAFEQKSRDQDRFFLVAEATPAQLESVLGISQPVLEAPSSTTVELIVPKRALTSLTMTITSTAGELYTLTVRNLRPMEKSETDTAFHYQRGDDIEIIDLNIQ